MLLDVVILAAGKGSRMHSKLPKVLHEVGGRPMLAHVFKAAESLAPNNVFTVVGHGADQIQEKLGNTHNWILQEQQLGTGHAVSQCANQLTSGGLTLILYGDVPLISADTLRRLLKEAQSHSLALLTLDIPDPTGYGRILRSEQGDILGIVEQKDATSSEKEIKEVNTGIMACSTDALTTWLPKLKNKNAQQEYYLTDIVAMAVQEGKSIVSVQPNHIFEVEGVNNRQQLALVEEYYQTQQIQSLMEQGVTFVNPKTVTIRGEVKAETDVIVDVNVVLEGSIVLGEDVYIGPNSIIKNSIVGQSSRIESNSLLEQAEIGRQCVVGPFARLRPGTKLMDQSKVGNFVEIKKSQIGVGSKVNHLSYIGDAEIGEHVNVGAGTITCNYDGVSKHKTTIDDNAFIGSNSALVAPVSIGRSATVAAGSVVTKDVPSNALVIARTRQIINEQWQRPKKVCSSELKD